MTVADSRPDEPTHEAHLETGVTPEVRVSYGWEDLFNQLHAQVEDITDPVELDALLRQIIDLGYEATRFFVGDDCRRTPGFFAVQSMVTTYRTLSSLNTPDHVQQ